MQLQISSRRRNAPPQTPISEVQTASPAKGYAQ